MQLLDRQNGVVTSGQILTHLTRHAFESAVESGALERIWHGIYCYGEPTEQLLLRGLDLACGRKVPLCLASAAAVHGFDTEDRLTCTSSIRQAANCVRQTDWWCIEGMARH